MIEVQDNILAMDDIAQYLKYSIFLIKKFIFTMYQILHQEYRFRQLSKGATLLFHLSHLHLIENISSLPRKIMQREFGILAMEKS